jgi:hypothetical protein
MEKHNKGGFTVNEKCKEILEMIEVKTGLILNKKSIVGTIIAKSVSLIIAILFMTLRSKAKAKGKVGMTRLFTVLAVLFFVAVLASTVQLDDDDPCEAGICNCDDFEEELE